MLHIDIVSNTHERIHCSFMSFVQLLQSFGIETEIDVCAHVTMDGRFPHHIP
jgi:hypothetical protein